MAEQGLTRAMGYESTKDNVPAVVEVSASDLHGPGVVFCPNPKMPLWSNHPRVFLGVLPQGEVKCPYCSTVYRLKNGPPPTA